MRETIPQELRFWAFVEKSDSCWTWLGGLHARGYGRFTLNGKRMPAHRAAYAMLVAPVPEELVVCHKCDNKRCVNPEHLFVGTQRDNMLDWTRKGLNKAVLENRLSARGDAHWKRTPRGREFSSQQLRSQLATGARAVIRGPNGRILGTRTVK